MSEICAMLIMMDVIEFEGKRFTYTYMNNRARRRPRVREALGIASIRFSGENENWENHATDETTRNNVESGRAIKLRMANFSPYQTTTSRSVPAKIVKIDDLALLSNRESAYGFQFGAEPREDNAQMPNAVLILTDVDTACWKQAIAGFRTYGKLDYIKSRQNAYLKAKRKKPAYVLARRSSEWPVLGVWNSTGVHVNSKAILAGFTLAGFVYGAIHLIAWSAQFPSDAEKILWRASGLTLMASGFILGFAVIVPYDSSNLFGMCFAPCAFALMFYMVLCYVAARIYLVVECFITLTYLPLSAYEVPQWSQYFPHIM